VLFEYVALEFLNIWKQSLVFLLYVLNVRGYLMMEESHSVLHGVGDELLETLGLSFEE